VKTHNLNSKAAVSRSGDTPLVFACREGRGRATSLFAACLAVLLSIFTAHSEVAAEDLREMIAADQRLSLFTNAATEAGLMDRLAGPGPLVLFIPSDQALANEGSDFLLNSVLLTHSNSERLADLVRHHIVEASSQAVTQADVTTLPTIANVPLQVTRVGDALIVAGYASVIDQRVAENGVVYIVDRLLWPRDPRWNTQGACQCN